MAKSSDINRDEIATSTVQVPEYSLRDDYIKRLDELCYSCVRLARDYAAADSKTNDPDLSRPDLMKACKEAGVLEERLFTAIDAVHKLQREALDKGVWIAVSHTEMGLPVRVAKLLKKRICD